VLGAAWSLLGGRGRDFMDNPFAARTPADFWRRYNRPVHQFLAEDVFVPAGGRRFPFRGALLAFVLSALIHEYVFSIPIGRIQGFQTTFFLLQGLAVAATMRLRPRGLAAAACVVATFAFNMATGVLFFASVNELLPFYRNSVPLWD
jgi:D-alanyl-lipoteichoic acid acyltransferase DltB (MBOAT superfamily)